MKPRLRVLVITKLFPNRVEPGVVPFIRQQLKALSKLCDLQVLATIPWFPGARAFSRWSLAGRLTRVPASDVVDGIPVRHPRTLFMPRFAYGINGALYVASVLPVVAGYRDAVDVLLGLWAYPDGVATVALGHLLGLPSVVKVVGTDINVVSRMPGPRLNIRTFLPRADRVIAVSRPLAGELEHLGIARDRIDVVYNGTDPELFRVRDRGEARSALGRSPDERLVLFVGKVSREKGVLDLLDAFDLVAQREPRARLVLLGDGPEHEACQTRARTLGGRLQILAQRPLQEVPQWLAACDLVALPSWNEGTPNVLLEAIACGRRVVATAVGGIPDIMASGLVGEMVPVRQPSALAQALFRGLQATYQADEVAAQRINGDWEKSALELSACLERAVEEHHPTRTTPRFFDFGR